MTLAKFVGFDLCPRLARLKKRRLYLPRGLGVPPILQPIVAETVSRRAISQGWDGLLRLGASVKHGWYPATEALDRFSSVAAGDEYRPSEPSRTWLSAAAWLVGTPGSMSVSGRRVVGSISQIGSTPWPYGDRR